MILITDLLGRKQYINSDLIQEILLNPDTMILFINGNRIRIKDTAEDLIEKIIEFRKKCSYSANLVAPVISTQGEDDE